MRHLLLAAFLVIVGLSDSISNPPTPAQAKSAAKPEANAGQDTNKAAPDKLASKDSATIIEISKAPTIHIEAIDKTQKSRDYTSAEWWSVYITGSLATITIALAVFTGWLWLATRDLVNGARDTSKRELRPYVGLEEIFFTDRTARLGNNRVGIGPTQTVRLIIKNYGKTPGYSVSVFGVRVKEIPTDTIDNPFNPAYRGRLSAGEMIYPGQTHSVDFPYETGFGFGDDGFLIYGMINYFDPLGKMDWTFRFCRRYMGNNIFVPYGRYNDETGVTAGANLSLV